MKETIAMLGLGAMGSRMASRLLDAGHDVVVYNRHPERAAPLVKRGATAAPSPHAAARGADVVISVVRDDEASKAVWLDAKTGALRGMKEGAIAVESSTLTPMWAKALAGQMQRAGVRFVDAPVSGSRPQAETGQLIYLVGGEREVIDAIRDVLLAMGGAVHHVGPVGAGSVMKLGVNALLGIQVAALAEILGMTRRFGIADAEAVELLGSTPVTSMAAKAAGALMVARKFEPLFPIELLEKDLGYAVDTSRSLGARAPTTSAVRAVFENAIEAGLGADNMVGVMKLFD